MYEALSHSAKPIHWWQVVGAGLLMWIAFGVVMYLWINGRYAWEALRGGW